MKNKISKIICVIIIIILILIISFSLYTYIDNQKAIVEFKRVMVDFKRNGNYHMMFYNELDTIEMIGKDGHELGSVNYNSVVYDGKVERKYCTKDIITYRDEEKVLNINKIENTFSYYNNYNDIFLTKINAGEIPDMVLYRFFQDQNYELKIESSVSGEFNGEPCYILKVDGEYIYIDRKTFLPIGIKAVREFKCIFETNIIEDVDVEIPSLEGYTDKTNY